MNKKCFLMLPTSSLSSRRLSDFSLFIRKNWYLIIYGNCLRFYLSHLRRVDFEDARKKQTGKEVAVRDIIIVLREEEMLRNMRICLPINFKQEKKRRRIVTVRRYE